MGDRRAARLAGLMRRLAASQWLAPDRIEAGQYAQLRLLARHAARHSPQFARRLAAAGLRADDLATPEGLRRLPPLRRRDVQAAGDDLYCRDVPPGHAPLNETRTSGSTGEPVVIRRTGVTSLIWAAMTLRDHYWHRRDFQGRLASIRANLSKPVRATSWGQPASLLHPTGPSEAVPITTDIPRQVDWLRRFDPNYLIVYPNNLAALVRHCDERGIRFPGLRQIRTVGETLSPSLRQAVHSVLETPVADLYSSQEVGNIALQCPEGEGYHVMAESVLVEVLDDQGAPCSDGQVGRVVISDLHNFATPLIRYDIGDMAEPGGRCACGRGLPTLRRILGRERNLLLLPDGSRHWPLVGFARFREVAPIQQYQMVQHSRSAVEVRLVCERPLTRDEETRLGDVIRGALGYPFDLDFIYFAGELPRSPGGKFEEFVCKAT